MYYIHDYSNKIGRSMSWLDSQGISTIFSPSGGGSTVVPYDNNKINGKRYFVVGCFDSAGYPSFTVKGKTVRKIKFRHCQ